MYAGMPRRRLTGDYPWPHRWSAAPQYQLGTCGNPNRDEPAYVGHLGLNPTERPSTAEERLTIAHV